MFPMEIRQDYSIGATRHIPRPVIEVDEFPETRAVIDLIDPDGVSETD